MNIAEIKARAEKATPGPWESVPVLYAGQSADGLTSWSESEGRIIAGPPQKIETETASARWFTRFQDGDFIAHARQDIPDLIAHVDELELELERLRILMDNFWKAQKIARAEFAAWSLAMKAPARPEYKQEFDGG